MIKIAVCDDNEPDRIQLEKFCHQFFDRYEECEIFSFSSGEDYICRKVDEDLLLLDIEMEGMSGLMIKDLLGQKETIPKILFISSHSEAMAEAFGKEVYGFLVKPVVYEIFAQKMQSLYEVIEREQKRILLKGVCREKMIRMTDILYVKADKKYVDVYVWGESAPFFDGRSIMIWQELLDGDMFAMSHRSYLVNLDKIDWIRENVKMENGDILPVSRRIKKDLEQKYRKRLVGTAWLGE